MAVAFDAATASHGSGFATSVAWYSWTHTPVGTPAGAYVITIGPDTSTELVSGVTYGGVSMSAVGGGSAVCATAEPGIATLWQLNSGVPTGAQPVVVTRTNDANASIAVSYTVTATGTPSVTGIVLQTTIATLTEAAVTDGSPGTNSVRFAAGFFGGSGTVTIGANSTQDLNRQRASLRTVLSGHETTAGQGSRSVGFDGGSDDRAFVHWAVKESSIGGTYITSVAPSTFDSGDTGVVITGYGFGASQGSSTVTIGAQAQTVTAWSNTSITITTAKGSNTMGLNSLKVTIV